LGIGGIRAEVDRRYDGLQLETDARLGTGLLDDGLSLLAERVCGRLEDQGKPLAVPGAGSVPPPAAAGRGRDLLGPRDVERSPDVGRLVPREVQDVRGDAPESTVEVPLDRLAVDEEAQGRSHGGVSKHWM